MEGVCFFYNLRILEEEVTALPKIISLLMVLGLLFLLAYSYCIVPIQRADVPGHLQHLEGLLRDNHWEEALSHLHRTQEAWLEVRGLIVLNVGIDSLLFFETALLRLEKAIEYEEVLPALLELSMLEILWEEFVTI